MVRQILVQDYCVPVNIPLRLSDSEYIGHPMRGDFQPMLAGELAKFDGGGEKNWQE